MQILVMYFSGTGNTRKLAERVVEGVEEVEGVDVLLKEAGEVTEEDFTGSQGIIAGSPVYFGSMAAQLKEVFDKYVTVRKQMADKVGAAFATAGCDQGGRETTLLGILQAMMIYGMIVVGDPLEATGHYGVSCTGSPDEATSENARKLGRRVAALAKKIGD